MFVRTKNRIYEVESETCGKQGYYIEGYEYDVILKEQVINQSDSIEKLCDEFVIVFEDKMPFLCDLIYKDDKSLLIELAYRYKEAIIYGTIWTDKGLIYVAKMNDKGELELI